MSYDDENRRGGYGGDQAGYSGAQNSGYRRAGGEADEYFHEGDRPSGGQGGGQGGGQRPGDERREDYGGQGGGRRYDDENNGRGHGGSAASYGSGGGHDGGSSGYDQDEAIKQARKHGNEKDGNLFSQAMSFLGNKKNDDNEDIDEQQMVGAHQQLYGNHSSGSAHDSNSLGAGAAMQALKMFTGGGAGAGGMGSHGAGNSQSQFIGMAMAQASKLFDQQNGQGNVASGADKQSAVNAAAKMALKMYMKSEGQGGGGGQGGLLGMASKFM